MESLAGADRNVARRARACQRCRRRKQKCDLKYPGCSNCETAQVPCLVYDAGKQIEIPRNYVSHLEARIEKLNQELYDLRSPGRSESVEEDVEAISAEPSLSIETSAASNPTPGHLQDLIKSVRNSVVEPSTQPKFLGPSSGITLARMVMASIRMDAIPASSLGSEPGLRTQASSIPTSAPLATPTLAASEASLPPQHAADHLVDVYFQYRTPHMPIVSRAQVEKAIASTYSSLNGRHPVDRGIEKDIFITYMVFAIALCNVPNPAGGTGRPIQSEGCFRSATYWIEKVVTYSKSDVETLRSVLFLAQFVSMCPWRGSLWHLTGIALRLCIDIGLHWESEEQGPTKDAEALYDRRRLWYSAYHFDRVLSITLGRPLGIIDESTCVPLPNPWTVSRGYNSTDYDTHHQRAHNHLFSIAKLESEIKHVYHSLTSPLRVAYPRPNYEIWLQDIYPRLREWYSTTPNPAEAHPSSIFAIQAYWDIMYNNAILHLHRPSPTIQQYSSESLTISYNAARRLISGIKILQRDGRLDVLWKSVHDLFMAGLTVIYCVWQSSAVRAQHPVSESVATLQSCASTLSAMSVNFSGGIGCRDVFETLSAATVDWLITNDAEETSRNKMAFEKQVQDLLGNFQLPRNEFNATNDGAINDMSTMLSMENFAFGEMLNSAAQWPEAQELDFGDLEFQITPGIVAS